MLISELFQIPLEFIKEHLTGWVLLIIIILILYFIYLRNYYVQRELFFNSLEDVMKSTNTNIHENKDNNEDEDIEKTENTLLDNEYKDKQPATANKKEKHRKYNDRDSLKEEKNNKPVFEGFENTNIIKNNFNTSNIGNTSNTVNTSNTDNNMENDVKLISTTIFDNLNLSPAQIQTAIINYNKVIANYIIEFGNLSRNNKQNPYLNVKKQFDLILAKGIDNIINFLNNTIKTPNRLTRTTIRTDVLNTLSNTLETLIDITNKLLVVEMSRLAGMNSTTIDYNTELGKINENRKKLDTYMAIDKLISEYGRNNNIKSNDIDKILNKSILLPIYERNFDKIQRLVNSDFNENEILMAEKYGKAYTEFLEQEKKESLNINPIVLASNIESGIINLLTGYSGQNVNSQNVNSDNNNYDDNYNNNKKLIEQYTRDYGYIPGNSPSPSNIKTNPIPDNMKSYLNKDNNLNDGSNIFKDTGNRGGYLINNNAQKQLLEGFENGDSRNTNKTNSNKTNSNSNENLIKAINSNSSKNTKSQSNNNTNILDKLLNGDFLQYVMDTTNDTIGTYYNSYDSRFKTLFGNFKIEDNLIPGGFLLFVLSMLIYFMDITSPTSQ